MILFCIHSFKIDPNNVTNFFCIYSIYFLFYTLSLSSFAFFFLGKDSDGWQFYFEELIFGLKDKDGRNAVVHARTSQKYKKDSGGNTKHKNLITEMLESAKNRILDRQSKLEYQRWIGKEPNFFFFCYFH